MSSPYAMEYFRYLDKITNENNYSEAVKKFPLARDFLIFWWRHPLFFVRPRTYAVLKVKRKFAAPLD
jgi:hypothetical protein